MLTPVQVLTILERIREIPSILTVDLDDVDSSIALVLDGDTNLYGSITNSFLQLMKNGEEVDDMNLVKYPYMIYNDELPGHFTVVLSSERALIHEFEEEEYYERNEDDAHIFMVETSTTDYLGNPAGGTLRYVPISESIGLLIILEKIDEAYNKIAHIIYNSSPVSLINSPLIESSEYKTTNPIAVSTIIISQLDNTYKDILRDLIIVREELLQ